MDETARALSNVAADTNERVTAVASASDEASANVKTVAATAEELAVSVGDIGTRVSTASHIVADVTENARTANLKVEGLAAAAQRIGDVVSLIQDVAAQTNLLALNATIEAARGTEDVVAHMPGVTKAVDETSQSRRKCSVFPEICRARPSSFVTRWRTSCAKWRRRMR